MSVDVVSPILHSIDNLGGILKRAREFEHDYSDLGFSVQRAKRLKLETDLDEKSRVRFGYIPKGVGLRDVDIERLRNENTRNLLLNRKLHLVLDLDHTLLNTTFLDELSPDEEYLKTQTEADHHLQYVNIVDSSRPMMTKLRPYIRTFLLEASKMFELSIYTMGDRRYALEMAKLLDPGNQIFGGRVISRSDSTVPGRKNLDVLLARESAVVILDDTRNVWVNENRENVVDMPRYHFFRSSGKKFGHKGKPFSESKTDECDRFGGAFLAGVLQHLRHVHTIFFMLQGDLMDWDVRLVLNILRKQVLKGCKVVFSHIFPSSVEAATHPLWKLAEELGANCSTEVDESVTHVVATNALTQKAHWARREKKFLVNPQWILTANYMLQRQPEDSFPIPNINSLSLDCPAAST